MSVHEQPEVSGEYVRLTSFDHDRSLQYIEPFKIAYERAGCLVRHVQQASNFIGGHDGVAV